VNASRLRTLLKVLEWPSKLSADRLWKEGRVGVEDEKNRDTLYTP
jgi:hypothetical protein